MPTPRRGLSLIELLIVTAIISVLAAIILPATMGARENGRATACRSNLRQLELALKLYADDHDGGLPGTYVWESVLTGSRRPRIALWCPSTRQFVPGTSLGPGSRLAGYGYSSFLSGLLQPRDHASRPMNLAEVRFPATTVAFCDAQLGRIALSSVDMEGGHGGTEQGALRHRGGANYAFLDGHVKWHRPEQVGGTNNGWPQDGTRPNFLPW
jgi:prepilin-type N-terminal cleavage/methylation domain-containing protein/prepilin-type processing-associated H-X9-DG protein